MSNESIDWIFFDFFQKLQLETRIKLDLQQYRLFLKCLHLKTTIDEKELNHLCKTLWLTHPDCKEDFDRIFEGALKKIHEIFNPTKKSAPLQPENISSNIRNGIKENDPEKISETSTSTSDKNPNNFFNEGSKAWENININISESLNGNAENSDSINSSSLKDYRFIFSDAKCLPFDVRTIEQGWRRLKGKEEYTITNQLDIKAIIKRKHHAGFIDKLLYKTESHGNKQAIWLSDYGGSMAPFAYWDDALFDILKKAPNTGLVKRYFFHDCPIRPNNEEGFLLFTNRAFSNACFLSEILKNINKSTIVIIFSDGGAARKRTDMERVNVFFELIKILRKKTHQIVWLNPVKNIEQTSASYISYFVKTEYPVNKSIRKSLVNI